MAIGTIGLRAFDKGLVETLGAALYPMVVDGVERSVYAVDVDGVKTNLEGYDGRVPVMFALPEDVFQTYKLPCFIVRRNDLKPAFERAPWYVTHRAPSDGAGEIIVPTGRRGQFLRGWDSYDTKRGAMPFDISYDVQILARRHMNGIRLLTYCLQRCPPPFFTMSCEDSIGDKRLYDCGEVAVSSASELADIADRTMAWTISFEIRGELDLGTVQKETDLLDSMPEIGITKL